jgi:hypothetical protein
MDVGSGRISAAQGADGSEVNPEAKLAEPHRAVTRRGTAGRGIRSHQA